MVDQMEGQSQGAGQVTEPILGRVGTHHHDRIAMVTSEICPDRRKRFPPVKPAEETILNR